MQRNNIHQGAPVIALDVGCAAGYCLEVMTTNGWITKALELDDEMCESLQKAGYDISRSSIEDFAVDNKFSVITLFDVIEHIPILIPLSANSDPCLPKKG
jgi:2-polyprenyl-3-methyl-5-hydroxy-6-metoxy-1,4-benzoquinol methylase